MNEQLKINENILTINNIDVSFNHNIRDVQICGDLIIVLLAIPFNETELDNLYAISKLGKIVWRSQELNKVFPDQYSDSYEFMNVNENEIKVTDFHGRRYFIDPLNGFIKKRDIVK
ncbi:hypothetical protein V7150_03480 [Neobacillus drentensis]|uniref:hypothetical protein n=1 Tax=Neobacillus drentensis TaxID=220684 RepID=UPI003000E93F